MRYKIYLFISFFNFLSQIIKKRSNLYSNSRIHIQTIKFKFKHINQKLIAHYHPSATLLTDPTPLQMILPDPNRLPTVRTSLCITTNQRYHPTGRCYRCRTSGSVTHYNQPQTSKNGKRKREITSGLGISSSSLVVVLVLNSQFRHFPFRRWWR
jgi:hypothetical protein